MSSRDRTRCAPGFAAVGWAVKRFGYSWKRAKRTRRFLARYGQRIRLLFLPTYSPWLKRIEETWRIVKAKAATNAWRDSLDHLTADYQATLTAMEARILTPTPCFLSE